MSTDTEARAILSEFSSARRIAIGTFMRRWGRRARWFRSEDAQALVAERLCIFAGLMPTTNPTGRDGDAGKLAEWREVAATKPDPAQSLHSLITRKLINDLYEAAFRTPRQYWQPNGALSLDLLQEEFEWDAPADIDQDWPHEWTQRYPISTLIYRDRENIESLKRVLHRGKDGIRRQLHEELAQLRQELVT